MVLYSYFQSAGDITMPRVPYITMEEALEIAMDYSDSIGGDVDVVNILADDSD